MSNHVGVFQFAVVELVRRELSDGGVHAVLDVQHEVRHPALQKSLEQAAAVASLAGVLREHSGWKLLLISHQNHLAGLVAEWYQICQLNRLAGFIDDEVLKFSFLNLSHHLTS